MARDRSAPAARLKRAAVPADPPRVPPAPRARLAVAAALAAALVGCSHRPPPPPPVLAPPLVELSRLGALGMIEFGANGSGDLAPLASREFLASLQAAQPGTPVLELGDRERVLAAVGAAGIDPETIRAIGRKYHLDAILVGELTTEEVRPRVSMQQLDSFSATAEIEGVLSARIFETGRGATLWTTNAKTRAPLAHVAMSPFAMPDFDAREPEQVRTRLVRELVARATDDFQPHWVNP